MKNLSYKSQFETSTREEDKTTELDLTDNNFFQVLDLFSSLTYEHQPESCIIHNSSKKYFMMRNEGFINKLYESKQYTQPDISDEINVEINRNVEKWTLLTVDYISIFISDFLNQLRLDEAFKMIFILILKNEKKDLSDEDARLIIDKICGCNFSNSFDFYNMPMLRSY